MESAEPPAKRNTFGRIAIWRSSSFLGTDLRDTINCWTFSPSRRRYASVLELLGFLAVGVQRFAAHNGIPQGNWASRQSDAGAFDSRSPLRDSRKLVCVKTVPWARSPRHTTT